ncbi:DUF3106 domain-containing protein [Lysobacter korlensis]|uniref:DUF3106 domain-containing protein n=1 Tax=Lysobacter korlensis TaxID=553636 RepID=A0ABV6RMU6_9GAMM
MAIAAALPARATPASSLPAWEQLTPQQREQLIAPIRDRWNSEPAQRQRMLLHAQRWQHLTPEQRQRARHGVKRWQKMPPEHREQMRAVFDHVRAMREPERRVFMAKWRSMTAEQKRAWLQVHPAPTPRNDD